MSSRNFGDILKELRKERRISQTELGVYLDVGKTAVCNYETGVAVPSSDKLIILANIFGVSIDYLLGRTDKQGEPYEGYGHFKEDGESYSIAAKVPLYKEITSPELQANDAAEFVNAPQSLEELSGCFALYIQRDTCAGEVLSRRGIRAGDTLFVRKQTVLETGDIGLIFVEGEGLVIGGIKNGKNSISVLQADGQPMRKYILDKTNVHIIGKAIYAMVKI